MPPAGHPHRGADPPPAPQEPRTPPAPGLPRIRTVQPRPRGPLDRARPAGESAEGAEPMSRPHADFVSARLRLWQRRVKETAGLVVLPEAGTAQADLMPVLDQLVAVHNLTSGLVSDLRQTAESSLAGTDVGCQYLSRLAAALAHSSLAATHLS